MQILNKIKSYIIHLLGGYTQSEVTNIISEFRNNNFTNKQTLISIIMQMHNLYLFSKSQYGKSADEWCKRVWAKIIEVHDDVINKEFKE